MEKLVCEQCGGENIESPRWENPNTGKLGIPFEGVTEDPINWCKDCQENVVLELKSDNNSTFTEAIKLLRKAEDVISGVEAEADNNELDFRDARYLWTDIERFLNKLGEERLLLDGPRKRNIHYITKVIRKWGGFTISQRQLDSSPVINSLGSGNICELVEGIFVDSVDTIIYNNGTEIEYHEYTYEDLDCDIISEIAEIVSEYEADTVKTEKRCSN